MSEDQIDDPSFKRGDAVLEAFTALSMAIRAAEGGRRG